MTNPNDPDMQCDFSQPITWIPDEEETDNICPCCGGSGREDGVHYCRLCDGKGEVELDENGNRAAEDD